MSYPRLALLAMFALTAAPLAFGQHAGPPAPRPAYRIEFFLSAQAANKPAAVQEYSMVVEQAGGQNQIRTGEKVPIEASTGIYTYQNVGVSLNCYFGPEKVATGSIPLRLSVEIASLSQAASAPLLPIISSAFAMVHTAVPLGRRVTVSSFDDATTHTHYQLAVLAQPAAQ